MFCNPQFYFLTEEVSQEEKDLKIVFRGNNIQSSLNFLGVLPCPRHR